MSKKIVINACYGGFGLSESAMSLLSDLHLSEYSIPRDHPRLISVVETLKSLANGYCANLKVVEIPDNVEWDIEEYDGLEHIAEKHRTWS